MCSAHDLSFIFFKQVDQVCVVFVDRCNVRENIARECKWEEVTSTNCSENIVRECFVIDGFHRSLCYAIDPSLYVNDFCCCLRKALKIVCVLLLSTLVSCKRNKVKMPFRPSTSMWRWKTNLIFHYSCRMRYTFFYIEFCFCLTGFNEKFLIYVAFALRQCSIQNVMLWWFRSYRTHTTKRSRHEQTLFTRNMALSVCIQNTYFIG